MVIKTTSTAPAAKSSCAVLKISPDATCGGKTGYTCRGSTFGNCCSSSGWCGSSSAYCGTGCNPLAGTCTGQTSPVDTCIVAAAPSATTQTAPASAPLAMSKDARCGPDFKQTCSNSVFGSCCSRYGYCGSTTSYCATGCQVGYGLCSSSAKRAHNRRQGPGAAGPDYTMPPVPVGTVTVTTGQVQTVTVTPASGIATTTVYSGVSTLTVTSSV
ncbi:hypothetical protein CC86DRAFT_348384 [Ophiobolus disseminans]|uniref:Chitin-binding type-1 domain-containing protein n=1 Tax=Ophiobolus disseminans TaxID=1469910 RepID=A0A6A7A6G3_9PLEO|nr:hypothetical protein CC86DRAFT_348384 [Ophiobolus disseminans]